jgi:hypothetical protein
MAKKAQKIEDEVGVIIGPSMSYSGVGLIFILFGLIV